MAGGGAMTEHRLGADPQDRSQPAGPGSVVEVADRVDAAGDAVLSPDLGAVGDLVPAETEIAEFGACNPALGPCRDRGDRLVNRRGVTFLGTIPGFVTPRAHGAEDAREGSTDVRRDVPIRQEPVGTPGRAPGYSGSISL
jgi:hypothetical protein